MKPHSVSIISLPPEIIIDIFLWLKAYANVVGERIDGPPHCLNVSHVSRHWRSLAIACQELWADWPRYGSASQWTQLCCERSLEVPINLHLNAGCMPAETTELAFRHLVHARNLQITADAGHRWHFFNRNYPLVQLLATLSHDRAPRLKRIALITNHTSSPIRVPGEIFDARDPIDLEELVLYSFDLSVTPGITFSNMRVLALVHSCPWRTVDGMIDFMGSLPSLEDFTFVCDDWDFKDTSLGPDVHPVRCVYMPRMRQFNLLPGGGFMSCMPLFCYLNMPIGTALHIGADVLPGDVHRAEELVSQTVEALRTHFAAAIAERQCYDAVAISDRVIKPVHQPDCSTLAILPMSFSLTIPRYAKPYISWALSWEPDFVSKTLCAAYLALPIFAGASSLHLLRTSACRPFLEHISSFSSLRVLTLVGNVVADFIWQYRPSPDILRDIPGSQLLSALEVLRLADFDCGQAPRQATMQQMLNAQSHTKLTVAQNLCDTLYVCLQNGHTKTWRRLDFVNCKHQEEVARLIREEPRLVRFNQDVQINCTSHD